MTRSLVFVCALAALGLASGCAAPTAATSADEIQLPPTAKDMVFRKYNGRVEVQVRVCLDEHGHASQADLVRKTGIRELDTRIAQHVLQRDHDDIAPDSCGIVQVTYVQAG